MVGAKHPGADKTQGCSSTLFTESDFVIIRVMSGRKTNKTINKQKTKKFMHKITATSVWDTWLQDKFDLSILAVSKMWHWQNFTNLWESTLVLSSWHLWVHKVRSSWYQNYALLPPLPPPPPSPHPLSPFSPPKIKENNSVLNIYNKLWKQGYKLDIHSRHDLWFFIQWFCFWQL